MLNHIAFFNFKKSLSDSDKKIAAFKLKEGLENLNGKINGMQNLKAEILLLESSTADMLVTAGFKDQASFESYKNSPLMFNVKPIVESSVDNIQEANYIA